MKLCLIMVLIASTNVSKLSVASLIRKMLLENEEKFNFFFFFCFFVFILPPFRELSGFKI